MESDPCRTPKGSIGNCIKLHQCVELLSLLKKPFRTEDDWMYVRDSFCGVSSKKDDSLVCCPSDIIAFPVDQSNMVVNESPKQFYFSEPDDMLPKDCGIDMSNRIVGGEVTNLDEFPWMALLEYRTPNGPKTACGGALIHKRYVLTAAHCLAGKDVPYNWKLQNVRLGEWNVATNPDCISTGDNSVLCADEHMTIPVESQIINEGFQPCRTIICSSDNQQNDIALLRLSQDVPFTYFVHPICLPKNENLARKFWVAGWGQTESSLKSDIKLKVQLPLVDKASCQKSYDDMRVKLSGIQICAGGEQGKDSCRGDSGGPLMQLSQDVNGNQRWVAVGVTSFGPSPCGKLNHPGVYIKVYDFMPWILSKIRQHVRFPSD